MLDNTHSLKFLFHKILFTESVPVIAIEDAIYFNTDNKNHFEVVEQMRLNTKKYENQLTRYRIKSLFHYTIFVLNERFLNN
jgi:hypothetical protein